MSVLKKMEDPAPKFSRSRSRAKVEINEEPEILAIPARPRSRAKKMPDPEPPPEPPPVEEAYKLVKPKRVRKKPEPGSVPSKDVAFTSSRGPINFQAYRSHEAPSPYEHLHGSNRCARIMSAW